MSAITLLLVSLYIFATDIIRCISQKKFCFKNTFFASMMQSFSPNQVLYPHSSALVGKSSITICYTAKYNIPNLPILAAVTRRTTFIRALCFKNCHKRFSVRTTSPVCPAVPPIIFFPKRI